jgi:hypothetical protein
VHGAEQVQLDRAPVQLERDVLKGADHAAAGVVDPNVNAPESLHGGPGETRHRLRVRDVGRDRDRLRA